VKNFSYHICLLDQSHEKKVFSCGVKALDQYLIKQAAQDGRKYLSATYVLVEAGGNEVIGYYTLSSSSVMLDGLPDHISKKLPRYPMLPATLLGRLAVDKNYHGRNLGELLLVDALKKSLALSKKIGSIAVIVDAKDGVVSQFYKKYGFTQLLNGQHRLFMPMKAVKKLWPDA